MLVIFELYQSKKNIMNRLIVKFTLAICSILVFAACNKDETTPQTPTPTVVKEYSIRMSAANEIPANTRLETSTASLKIFSDNSVTLSSTFSNFTAGDTIKLAHIHVGDAVNNGPVVLPFTIVATGANVEAKATGVRQTLIDSLKNNVTNFYANIHSAQLPGGLARGQVGINVLQAYTVNLSGLNEPVPVTTTATGVAIVRINEDNSLISKITISNMETADTLRFAHIHFGATGINGPVITNLADTRNDFNNTQTRTIRASLSDTIATRTVYVNVHSNFSPGGKLRGQIR